MALDHELIVQYPMTDWGFFMVWELSAKFQCEDLMACIIQELSSPLSWQCYTEDCPLPKSYGGMY